MTPTPPPSNVLPLRPPGHEEASRIAMTWLSDRHRKGWRLASEDTLEDLCPDWKAMGGQLDEDGVSMVAINVGEWMLARGEIHARGALREINSYLLSREGPYLTPGQRAWIEQLRERPLRLYRVTDVRPGEGMTLVDELDTQAEPLVVRERSGSRSAHPGLLLGARIMQASDAEGEHLELSGAVYPFAKLREPRVLAQVRQALTGAEELKLHAENIRNLGEREIARAWMAQWFEPPPMPQINDASTGDPLLLVTDHYRVQDAAALSAALAAQPDVDGDAKRGWHRQAPGADEPLRSLVAINPGRRADRIELFYRTQQLADEGRPWFEALAGSAVKHLTREIVDPAGHLANANAGAGAGAGAGGRASAPAKRRAKAAGYDLPPEQLAQAFEGLIHRHYANWCDDTIPALGGLTPRQAIATPAGLERVKGLLREYEDGEQRQSADQGRSPVSYQFLWDGLGITR